MTVDSDAKKAKLDTSLTLVPTGMVLPQAQQHILSAVALANNQFLTNPPIISQAPNLAGVPAMAASTSTASLNGQRPSKVVHLRNIPSDMTELELLHFCMPYGKLVNYLMLKGKNQAFVEYEEEHGAQILVTMSSACPVAIRDRTIFCQFSTHQELKTDKRLRGSGFSMNSSENEANGEVGAFQKKGSFFRALFSYMCHSCLLQK
uniref:RRM domain-containing protein n=1 Tax=Parascaris univalens TaxID=6257 RepID=A0A915AMA7_PARUN